MVEFGNLLYTTCLTTEKQDFFSHKCCFIIIGQSLTKPSQSRQTTATSTQQGTRGGGKIPAGQNCREAAVTLLSLPGYCPTAIILPPLKTPDTKISAAFVVRQIVGIN